MRQSTVRDFTVCKKMVASMYSDFFRNAAWKKLSVIHINQKNICIDDTLKHTKTTQVAP